MSPLCLSSFEASDEKLNVLFSSVCRWACLSSSKAWLIEWPFSSQEFSVSCEASGLLESIWCPCAEVGLQKCSQSKTNSVRYLLVHVVSEQYILFGALCSWEVSKLWHWRSEDVQRHDLGHFHTSRSRYVSLYQALCLSMQTQQTSVLCRTLCANIAFSCPLTSLKLH